MGGEGRPYSKNAPFSGRGTFTCLHVHSEPRGRVARRGMGDYWENYAFYGLLRGCGAAVPAAQLHGLSRDACLQRCSSQLDCHAIAYHQVQAVCRVYTQCDDGELGSRQCAEEWCGYMRASWLKTAALNHVKIKASTRWLARAAHGARPKRADCPRLAEA